MPGRPTCERPGRSGRLSFFTPHDPARRLVRRPLKTCPAHHLLDGHDTSDPSTSESDRDVYVERNRRIKRAGWRRHEKPSPGTTSWPSEPNAPQRNHAGSDRSPSRERSRCAAGWTARARGHGLAAGLAVRAGSSVSQVSSPRWCASRTLSMTSSDRSKVSSALSTCAI
jgi:hypothetical protein